MLRSHLQGGLGGYISEGLHSNAQAKYCHSRHLLVLVTDSSWSFRLESMQGDNGGKEGTAFNMNFRPLLRPPEELEPSPRRRPWGGETRFCLGEHVFTGLMGVEASFDKSGVSSSGMSSSLISGSGHCRCLVSPNFVIGVSNELRQRRELPDTARILPWDSRECGIFAWSNVSHDGFIISTLLQSCWQSYEAFLEISFVSRSARLLSEFLGDSVNFASRGNSLTSDSGAERYSSEGARKFAACFPWLDTKKLAIRLRAQKWRHQKTCTRDYNFYISQVF